MTDTPEPILQYFKPIREENGNRTQKFISRCYERMAAEIVTTMDRSAERTVALRKLLESRDSAMRAAQSGE